VHIREVEVHMVKYFDVNGSDREVELRMRRLDESTKAAAAEAVVAAAGAKLAVASTTVRSVEIFEGHAKAGEWVQVDARMLLGTEQEAESVDPDEFCVFPSCLMRTT
jgi:hypothetical protein